MGFQIAKYKQKHIQIEIDQELADVLLDLFEMRLSENIIGVDDKIQRSIDAEVYNHIASKRNIVKENKPIKLKLLFHQAVQLWRVTQNLTIHIDISYRVNLEQLAGKIGAKL